jgi:hypothetical protein
LSVSPRFVHDANRRRRQDVREDRHLESIYIDIPAELLDVLPQRVGRRTRDPLVGNDQCHQAILVCLDQAEAEEVEIEIAVPIKRDSQFALQSRNRSVLPWSLYIMVPSIRWIADAGIVRTAAMAERTLMQDAAV